MTQTPAVSTGNTLQTPRLSLVPVSPALAGEVLALLQRNRAHFEPVEPQRPDGYYTLAHQRGRLAEEKTKMRAGAAAIYWLRLKENVPARGIAQQGGPLIGNAALSNIIRGPFCSAFVGYKLDAAHTGSGLMAEALNALIEHAFGPLGLHRLEANILPENDRSMRLAKHLGFVNEGIARAYMQIGGQWRDLVHMVLLNDAMPPPPG